ncbi:hypothetical protein C9374_013276 [Naegleria lovaniensis]|uniref:Uncharacterized protein n=1 Tax=Naegleria lovaniensis TaxID=51637 RepID=A0AA88KPS1_NAELO|nr:uncharacterized protein C9374_013276 [Naegleria lovaniensis]KAG2391791.1 hypothetical protein C9374_013276 [Naegleria lovaniensis]
MLTLPVEPGFSMGSFIIGMPISEAIRHLKQYVEQINRYPKSSELVMVQHSSSSISSSPNSSSTENVPSFSIVTLDEQVNDVEILYNEKEPLNNDIIVKIVEEDIVLYFESQTQRLKLIQINNVTKVKLSYSGTIFSGPSVDASFVNIYNVFGPTYPGEFDTKSNTYILTYPGLTFVFPIPTMYAHLYKDGQEMPIEFPNNTTPIATTIYLFHGHDLKNPKLPPVKPSSMSDLNVNSTNVDASPTSAQSKQQKAFSVKYENFNDEKKNKSNKKALSPREEVNYYFEPIQVTLGKGIELLDRKKKIKFGYTAQDVLMILGPPDKIYYKRNDKLKIHAIGAGHLSGHVVGNDRNLNGEKTAKPKEKFFENDGGISLTTLMAPSLKNRIKQNVGNDYFYNYFSLGFDIMFGGSTHTVQKIILHTNVPGSVDFNVYVKCNFSIATNQFEGQENRKRAFIGPDVKFSTVQQSLEGTPCSKPIVHDHTRANNPFGGTKFYAFKNCIFEVISRNDHVNSVTLFKVDS